jgi:protein TonB
MRIWQAILVSVLAHAALLNMPIGMSSNREPECVEMRFVIDAASAAAPAQALPRATVHAPVPEKATEVVKVPDLPAVPERSKKKAIVKQKTEPAPDPAYNSREEPVQPIEDLRPTDVSMPLPVPLAETVAAADQGGPEGPAGGNSAKQHAAVSGAHGTGHGVGAAAFGGSGGPGFISRVLPRYPRMAREMSREGTVVLSLTIDEQGILQDAEVAERAGFGFDEEALRAVRTSKFKPAVRSGKPVASRALLPVRFLLRGSGDD